MLLGFFDHSAVKHPQFIYLKNAASNLRNVQAANYYIVNEGANVYEFFAIIVRRIKINTLFLILFEGRSPSGKLNELLIGTMIISLVFIQFGDFCHFFLRESEI